MADSGDPPPRKKLPRAKFVEPEVVVDPSKPNATVELETADLLQLGQEGQVDAVHMTREMKREDAVIVELDPKPANEPSVVVEFGVDAKSISSGALPGGRVSTPMPAAEPSIVIEGETPHRQPTPTAQIVPARPSKPTPSPIVPSVNLPRQSLPMPAHRGGNGIVVLVYVLSALALAASVYLRWFRA